MDRWFYVRRGQLHGPLDWSALRGLARGGGLSPTTLVWGEGMEDWKPATDIPRLFPPKASAYRIQPEPRSHDSSASTAEPVPWYRTVGAGVGAEDSLWSGYHDYHRVPRFRRHEVNSLLCWLSIPFWPLCLWVCVVQWSGEIYLPQRNLVGELETWSPANRLAALALPGVIVLNIWLLSGLPQRLPELTASAQAWW